MTIAPSRLINTRAILCSAASTALMAAVTSRCRNVSGARTMISRAPRSIGLPEPVLGHEFSSPLPPRTMYFRLRPTQAGTVARYWVLGLQCTSGMRSMHWPNAKRSGRRTVQPPRRRPRESGLWHQAGAMLHRTMNAVAGAADHRGARSIAGLAQDRYRLGGAAPCSYPGPRYKQKTYGP